MTKNKLEKKFSASLKADPDLWGMKLHNNLLAHQTTPADYIITHFNKEKIKLTALLVECKQVTCKEGKGRLAFKRLKQMNDLLSFSSGLLHYSYFCIAFYDKRWDNSDVYLIPASLLNHEMKKESKVSFNREDMQKIFKLYRCEMKGNLIDLEELK